MGGVFETGDGMPQVQIGQFSLEVLPDWTLSTVILAGPVDEPSQDLGMLRGPTTRPFQRNLVATAEQVTEGETPETYLRRQIDGLRKAGVERTQIGRPETLRLEGGLGALLSEQVITAESGGMVRQMQLICVKEGVAYTLIASHLDGELFQSARDDFRRMLLSFR